jgi:hypothetical protein
MIIAFAAHLPFSARRSRGAVALYFAAAARSANIWIQCQLPEISVVFGNEARALAAASFSHGAHYAMIAFR